MTPNAARQLEDLSDRLRFVAAIVQVGLTSPDPAAKDRALQSIAFQLGIHLSPPPTEGMGEK